MPEAPGDRASDTGELEPSVLGDPEPFGCLRCCFSEDLIAKHKPVTDREAERPERAPEQATERLVSRVRHVRTARQVEPGPAERAGFLQAHEAIRVEGNEVMRHRGVTRSTASMWLQSLQ